MIEENVPVEATYWAFVEKEMATHSSFLAWRILVKMKETKFGTRKLNSNEVTTKASVSLTRTLELSWSHRVPLN